MRCIACHARLLCQSIQCKMQTTITRLCYEIWKSRTIRICFVCTRVSKLNRWKYAENWNKTKIPRVIGFSHSKKSKTFNEVILIMRIVEITSQQINWQSLWWRARNWWDSTQKNSINRAHAQQTKQITLPLKRLSFSRFSFFSWIDAHRTLRICLCVWTQTKNRFARFNDS